MVECGICLEEYQEGDLELHRQMCEVRLMFRCSLCDGDYVNKEGLWNHLDLHEIADESKEHHYQEIKAKHKLHQCVLCNDQRAYSEISYWKHVHDVHDDFFLKCSDCGENFRSEKFKNDHASSRCKARDPMEVEQVPIEDANMTADAEPLKLSWGDQSSNTDERPDNRLSIDYADKNMIDKDSELPTINLPSRFPCDICGKSFSSKVTRLRHKSTKHKEERHHCPHCSRKFYFQKRLEEHVSCCAGLKYSCELCGQRFNFQCRVEYHKKRVHRSSRPLRDANSEGADCTEEKKQGSAEKIDAAVEKTSCIVCRMSFASTDELMKHKFNCPKPTNEYDDSQFSPENISLVHGVSEAQADSTIGDNIEIKLEIEVEETMLQEQEFQVPAENPERFSATTLHPDGDKSKDDESDDADDLENEIKVKLECLDNEDETIAELRAEQQAGTISNQKVDAEVIGPANLIDLGYVPIKSCSLEEANLFVKNFEFGFGLLTQRNIKKGSMRYYRCLRLKKTARPQCERKLFICTPNKNEESTVCAKGEHSCINAPPENLRQTRHVKIDFGYAPVKTCSIEDAESFVRNFEFGFSLRLVHDREKGNMRYYCCSRIKRGARPQCDRKVLIFTPNKNEESTVCAKGEHSCSNAPPENLTDEQIDFGYTPVKTCSIEDAKSFVKNFEFGFCFRSDSIGKKGRMQYYLCSRIKKGARPQCERRVLICTPYTNEESTVYAKGEHSCINAPPENLTTARIFAGYALVKTCSFEDAKSFVENFEFGFEFRVENSHEKGNIQYYRCSRIKQQTGPQCKRKVLIFTPDTNEESMVCAKWEHSCTNDPPKNMTLQAQIDFGYIPVKTCSIIHAKTFVKHFEFGFSFQSEIISKKSSMQYYRCSRVKQSARPQCERKVLICTPDTNEESTVCAKGEHSCKNAPPENLIW